MKIASIWIDGFGVFHEERIIGLSPGLNLFLGDNEAGKSTLLGFLRTLFFGFPLRSNSKEPSYPPLAGGRPGGRIELLTAGGRSYTVERRPGKSGGEVIVTGIAGVEGSEETLQQLLGGITANVFRNVYAFSLSELQTLDSLREESVKSVIYGAAAGAGIVALPRAEKKLKQALEDLYKSSGIKPTINQQLALLEDLAKKRRDAVSGLAEYDAVWQSIRSTDSQIQNLREELARTTAEKELLRRYESILPDFHLLRDQREKLNLQEEQVLEFPVDGLRRLELELNQIENLEARVADCELQVGNARNRLGHLELDAGVLAEAETIEKLRDRRRDFEAWKSRLELDEQQLDQVRRKIRVDLESLGPDWSADRVVKIDRSIFTRETVLRHQTELSKAGLALQSASEKAVEAAGQLAVAEAAEQLASAALTATGGPIPAEDEDLLLRLEQGRSEIASSIRDLPHRQMEVEHERKLLADALAEIDPAWTAREVLAFDLSLPARDAVAGFDEAIRSSEVAVREGCAWLESRRDAHRELASKRDRLDAAITAMPLLELDSQEALDERRKAIRRLRELFERQKDLEREVAHLNDRLADKRASLEQVPPAVAGIGLKRLSWGILCSGIVAALVLAFSGRAEAGLIVAFASVVLAAIVFLVGRRRDDTRAAGTVDFHASLRAEISRIELSLADLQAQAEKGSGAVSELVSALGFPSGFGSEKLPELEARMEAARDLLMQFQRLEENRAELGKELEHLVAVLSEAEMELRRREDELGDTRERWKAFLRAAGMDDSLKPSLITSIFSKIEAMRQRIDGIRTLERRISKIEEVIRQYRELAGRLSFDTVPAAVPDLEFEPELARLLARARNRRDRYLVVSKEWEHCRAVHDQACKSSEDAERRLAAAQAQAMAARDSWNASLTAYGLPEGLSPETALEALARVEECVRQIDEACRLENEIQDLRSSIAGFESDLWDLEGRLGRPRSSRERILSALDALVDELALQRRNAQSRLEVQAQLEEAESALRALGEQLSRAQGRLGNLIEESRSVDIADFRRRSELYLSRVEILTSIGAAEDRLRRFRGELSLEKLEEVLAALDEDQLPGRLREYEEEEKTLNDLLEAARETKADLTRQSNSLKTSDQVLQLQLEEERARTALKDMARNWAKLAVAQGLIRQAKQLFEQQQQPRVVREAESFFSRITGSQYRHLLAPIGEETIEVLASNGERKKTEELSRGTAEQLYLALRFGYIRSRSENAEPLPVVMDDILVNFDPGRARRAAEAVHELAAGHQVLYFTCHPEVINCFQETAGDPVPVWTINQGRVAALGRE